VAKIKDTGMRTRYAVNLDRWLGMMDEDFVLARVRQHAGDDRREQNGKTGRRGSRDQQKAWDPEVQSGSRAGTDPVVQVEREALKLAVQRPALCGPEFDALDADAFTVPVHGSMFTLIASCGGTAGAASPREWAATLREQAPNERAQAFVTGLAVEALRIPGEPDTRYADMVLARVAELAVSREITAVKARLQRMNPVDEQAAYNRLFGDLMGLEKRRKLLVDRAAGM
jgi:DNA primase